MDDNRPDYKTYTAITPPLAESEEPTSMETPMEENEVMDTSKKSSALIIIGALIVLGLIIAGLFLPPISLGQRLSGGSGEVEVTSPATAVTEQSTIPGAINLSVQNARVSKLADEAASAALPALGVPQGDPYQIDYEGDVPVGSAALAIPADAGSLKTLDLYGWDGAAWRFIPSQIDANNQQIVSDEGPLPRALALLQTAVVDNPTISAELLPDQQLPVDILPQLTEVTVGALTLADDGQLQEAAANMPTGAYDQLLRATNVGAIVDQASLSALLGDEGLQSSHIDALVQHAAAGNYAGVNLDYQGALPDQADAFTSFVTALAAALHEQERALAITLGLPQRANNSWDTAGQDWAALGRAADAVYLQMPLNPTVYDDNGLADQLVNFATRRIDRTRLTLLTSANAVDNIGESFRELPNAEALSNFGELQFVQGGAEVEPGEPVEVALSGTAGPLEWDGTSLTYKYSYEQSGQPHNVWLGNDAALTQRLHLARTYNLRGVAVRGLGGVADGGGYAAAFNNFLEQGEAPPPAGAAIVWRVLGEDDSVLASSSGESLSFTWDGSEGPGEYDINVEFALGNNVAELGSLRLAVLEPEPVAETEEEEEAEETAETEDTADTESEAAASPSSFDPGDADAVVNTAANVRIGPGLSYGTIAGGAQPGTKLTLIGRNADSSWFNILMPDGQTEGWIFSTLVTVNSGVNIAGLPEVEAPPIVAGGDDGGGTAPPPVSAPPVTNAGFELGGQTHTFANPTLMASAGMNWVKFQHKWGSGDSPDAVAGRIQQAHANGFKVLLSIPGANTNPDSIDFNSYVNFLGGVAALGPDAIEVWNEMNIDFEWPAGQIDPTSYVNNMLAPAYNAIKSANPNVMVVSGAPAPTGFDNGTNAWADSRYLSGLAAAGAANYMDCMGAHFNAGATSPYQSTGHPAGSDHYSWHFQPMLNLYAGLGKPVCFTELGYLSGEDYGGVPSRFSWAGNTTVSQHAQWLGEAVSLAASSGRVRMVIVFNVDFTHFGDDPQAGYAMIRPGGGCPACETLRAVMGR